MQAEYGIVFPLWARAEPEAALDDLLGQLGLSHLVVPCVSGPVATLMLADDRPTGLFSSAGGWHYPTDAAAYAEIAVRPRSAGWFGKRNLLHRVIEAAAARGVRVDAQLDLTRARVLLEHEPHLAARNAWGSELPGALCPSNPNLRGLAEACGRELRAAGVGGVQWVGAACHPPAAQPRELRNAPAPLELLNLCFCSACRNIAAARSADPEAAGRSTQVHFAAWLEHARLPGWADLLEADDVLRGYVTATAADTHAWLERWAATDAAARWSAVIPAEHPAAAPRLPALVDACGHAGEPELDALARPADGPPRGLRCGVWRPLFARADALVRFVHDARSAGATRFDFTGLEAAPVETVQWLHQAIRFAHREDADR